MVGLTGFEPAASSSRTRRATKLRHSPMAGTVTGPQPGRAYRSVAAVRIGFRSARGVERQQRRLGAAGDPDPGVRDWCRARPRRAARTIPGRPGRESAGWRCRPLARAGSRSQLVVSAPTPGQADLAAVGVAGEDRVVPVGGELVEHPEVRRVRDAEPQVGVGVGRPGDRSSQVVSPGAGRRRRRTRSSCPPTSSRSAPVGQVEPAGVDERAPAGRARAAAATWMLRLAVVGQQVAQRVAQRRRVVVVGAEHEHARAVEQGAERVEHDRHRVAVGEVVAGVDDQVGLEVGERRAATPACGAGRASGGCR